MPKYKEYKREKAISKNIDDSFYFENNRKFYFKITIRDNEHKDLVNVKEELEYETINDFEKIKLKDGTDGVFYIPKGNLLQNMYENNLGSFLIEILNNSNNIIEIYSNTKKELEQYDIYKNEYAFVYILDILKNLIKNLKNCFPKYYIFLIFDIENFISNKYKENREFFGKEFSKWIEKIEQQSFKRKNECITFIDNLINNIRNVNELINTSFGRSISSYTGKEKTNTELQNMDLSVPSVDIKLGKKEDSNESYKEEYYIYKVSNLNEICNISILQLTYNNKVIVKCKNCGKYFIPINRSDTVYCNNYYITKKGKRLTCKQASDSGNIIDDEEKSEITRRKDKIRSNLNKNYHQYASEFKEKCKSIRKDHKYDKEGYLLELEKYMDEFENDMEKRDSRYGSRNRKTN